MYGSSPEPRYQRPKGGISAKNAASQEDRKAWPSVLPFLMYNSLQIPREDVREAVRFITERGVRRVEDF